MMDMLKTVYPTKTTFCGGGGGGGIKSSPMLHVRAVPKLSTSPTGKALSYFSTIFFFSSVAPYFKN